MRGFVDDAWREFEIAFVPEDAGPEQRRELHLAFMAGATALLLIVDRIGQRDVAEDDAHRVLDLLHREIAEWRAGLVAGRN
jgi:uncharacterized protein YfdQ (DUF2303 family)